MSAPRTVLHGLLLAAVAASAASAAPDTSHKPRRTAPAHPSHAAPDVTGTIVRPAPVPDATSPPHAADEAIPPPFKLPAASRERVRACGLAWRDMKLAGRTGDDDWRDFAEKCFVAKDAPATP